MSSSFGGPEAPVAATLQHPEDTSYLTAQTRAKVNP